MDVDQNTAENPAIIAVGDVTEDNLRIPKKRKKKKVKDPAIESLVVDFMFFVFF